MYFVTVFTEFDEEYGIGESRCVGYLTTFDDAEYRVKNNILDIREYTYDYAVIEKLELGLYPIATSRKFYKYDGKSGCYLHIREPECVKRWNNFALC